MTNVECSVARNPQTRFTTTPFSTIDVHRALGDNRLIGGNDRRKNRLVGQVGVRRDRKSCRRAYRMAPMLDSAVGGDIGDIETDRLIIRIEDEQVFFGRLRRRARYEIPTGCGMRSSGAGTGPTAVVELYETLHRDRAVRGEVHRKR